MDLEKHIKKSINSARNLGSGKHVSKVHLSDDELMRICSVIASDVDKEGLLSDVVETKNIPGGYYENELEWYEKEIKSEYNFRSKFVELIDKIDDFLTYFEMLCELHKRRVKYKGILEGQPLPEMDQVVPRSLLEYSLRPTEALASWIVWRKWLYDIDNRAAQESGYVFEPILAACLGGEKRSSKKSPIRRADNKDKGRQVDCILGQDAYEFKMRVTIAASGQGRFGEELAFAEDAQKSGYTPVLLVLDPTPSPKLTKLQDEYESYGGRAYIGEDAWEHIEEEAGPTMGTFIDKYVQKPIKDVDETYQSSDLLDIEIEKENNSIKVSIQGSEFSIER